MLSSNRYQEAGIFVAAANHFWISVIADVEVQAKFDSDLLPRSLSAAKTIFLLDRYSGSGIVHLLVDLIPNQTSPMAFQLTIHPFLLFPNLAWSRSIRP